MDYEFDGQRPTLICAVAASLSSALYYAASVSNSMSLELKTSG